MKMTVRRVVQQYEWPDLPMGRSAGRRGDGDGHTNRWAESSNHITASMLFRLHRPLLAEAFRNPTLTSTSTSTSIASSSQERTTTARRCQRCQLQDAEPRWRGTRARGSNRGTNGRAVRRSPKKKRYSTFDCRLMIANKGEHDYNDATLMTTIGPTPASAAAIAGPAAAAVAVAHKRMRR